MRPIPLRMRNILEKMPRMRMCEASWEFPGSCSGPIQWHHVWIYAGRQINELWGILGACEKHHNAVKTNGEIKQAFERRSLELATDEELDKYPKKAWRTLRSYLNR